MDNSKLKEVVGIGASWQLTYAILVSIVAVFSMYTNPLAAIFSLTMGIIAISSAIAAQKYKSSGNDRHLLSSFKRDRIYFILAAIYTLLILISIITVIFYIYRYGIEPTRSPFKWSLRFAMDWLKD